MAQSCPFHTLRWARLDDALFPPASGASQGCQSDETVTIGPYRVIRVEGQEPIPDGVGDWRERHRCPGVAGVRLLHGIHCQRSHGVYTQLVKLSIWHKRPSRDDAWLQLGTKLYQYKSRK